MRSTFLFILELGFLNCDIIYKMIIGNGVGVINYFEVRLIIFLTFYQFKMI
jgi:hypothetical protein